MENMTKRLQIRVPNDVKTALNRIKQLQNHQNWSDSDQIRGIIMQKLRQLEAMNHGKDQDM